MHLVGACGEDSVGRRNLAHVFERRKAIIDTAIVRLLKKAKFMAIDAIAMQVKLFLYCGVHLLRTSVLGVLFGIL